MDAIENSPQANLDLIKLWGAASTSSIEILEHF
jgi:hypothetical protein